MKSLIERIKLHEMWIDTEGTKGERLLSPFVIYL